MDALNEINPVLQNFERTTLKEMKSVKLMDRTDTKYTFNYNKLPGLLSELTEHYRLLEIDNKRTINYRTLYFDTPDFKFYHHHHNGKLNRYKVRIRKYLDSGLCYLEVKFKNNKRKTKKKRMEVSDFEQVLSEESRKYIESKAPPVDTSILEPKIWSEFTRLTLVPKDAKERITVDIGLKVHNDDNETTFPYLVIAEIKHERASSLSHFAMLMKKHHIRPMRISKYCAGLTLLYPELKYNRFKPRLLAINKIQNEAA